MIHSLNSADTKLSPRLQPVLDDLKSRARPDQLEGMARYGIQVSNALGTGIPPLREMAKKLPKDSGLAGQLWETGIHEARILSTLIADPSTFNRETAEMWALDFASWDLCDQACQNLFWKLPFAPELVHNWTEREEEFVRRAGFSLIAYLATRKKISEAELLPLFIKMEEASADPRHLVYKAASWAIRRSARLSPRLYTEAQNTAERLAGKNGRGCRFVANAVLKDLKKINNR